MVTTAFEALEAEHDPDGEGPVGLCLFVDAIEVIRRRRETVWPETKLAYVGYADGTRQVRVKYFSNARIA